MKIIDGHELNVIGMNEYIEFDYPMGIWCDGEILNVFGYCGDDIWKVYNENG